MSQKNVQLRFQL